MNNVNMDRPRPWVDFHRDTGTNVVHHGADPMQAGTVNDPLEFEGGALGANNTDFDRMRRGGVKIFLANVFPFKYRPHKVTGEYDGYPSNFQKEVQAQLAAYRALTEIPNSPVRLRLLTSNAMLESCLANPDEIGMPLSVEGLDDVLINAAKGRTWERNVELVVASDILSAHPVWNWRNPLATPHNSKENRGLTRKGREVVGELARNGVAIDLSHANRHTMDDVMETVPSDKLVFASHVGNQEENGHTRNLPKSIAQAIAERGGIMGMTFVRTFVKHTPDGGTVDDIAGHIAGWVDMGLEDHIGYGSDFEGMAHGSRVPGADSDDYVMDRMAEALFKKGLNEAQINKVAYQNGVDFLRRAFAIRFQN